MYNRILLVIVLVPLAIVLTALAVANREMVALTLDPFHPGNPALTLKLPLFVFLFVALLAGVLIGGAATWLRQGRYRKLARQQEREVRTLREAAARAAPARVPLPKPAA